LLKWTGIGFCWLVALGGVIEYSSYPYADESLLVVAIVFGALGYWLLRRR
jgi:hypothetical protein